MSVTTETILIRLKEWPSDDLVKFACKLLILAQPGFHGNKTINYANGVAKKLVDNITRDI